MSNLKLWIVRNRFCLWFKTWVRSKVGALLRPIISDLISDVIRQLETQRSVSSDSIAILESEVSRLSSRLLEISDLISDVIQQLEIQRNVSSDSIEIAKSEIYSTVKSIQGNLPIDSKLYFRLVEANQYLLKRVHRIELSQDKTRRLRCAFLVADTTLWDVYAPIYKKMQNSVDFELIVIAFERQDISSDKTGENVLSFFNSINIEPEMQGFDCEPIVPLSSFDLDVVFYTLGSAAYPEQYKIENVSLYSLTCYLSYGFLLVDQKNYQFNQPFHHAAWTVFASTERELRHYDDYSVRLESNARLVGYPKFDIYDSVEIATPNRPLIIWAPHWSIGDIYPALNFGTFDTNFSEFLDYIKSNPQIDFVFKPHPNLRYATEKLDLGFSGEGFLGYVDQLNELSNVEVNFHGDYFKLFANSSAMVTDSVSFLAEYLPTSKPLLFLDRKDRAVMSEVGEELISIHYSSANSFEHVTSFIDNVVIAGIDSKRTARVNAMRKLLNIGDVSTSDKIIDYLRSSFQID